MAKKEETKQVEETTEKVDVTMTPAERDEFVAFKLKQKEEEEKQQTSGEMIVVELKFPHHINGVKYGPGRNVKVPRLLLGHLQVYENRMRDHEIKLMTSSERNFEILSSGHSIERPGTKA